MPWRNNSRRLGIRRWLHTGTALAQTAQPHTRSRRFFFHAVLAAGAGVLLNGCLLASGRRTSSDVQAQSGNVTTTFVSAEGEETNTVETGAAGDVAVIAIVGVEQGQLRLDMLDQNGSVVFSVDGRPNESRTFQGQVATDDRGRLRYRVFARQARNGSVQLLYQRQ